MRTSFYNYIDSINVCGVDVKKGDVISFKLKDDDELHESRIQNILRMESCSGHNAHDLVDSTTVYITIWLPVISSGHSIDKIPLEWFTDVTITP